MATRGVLRPEAKPYVVVPSPVWRDTFFLRPSQDTLLGFMAALRSFSARVPAAGVCFYLDARAWAPCDERRAVADLYGFERDHSHAGWFFREIGTASFPLGFEGRGLIEPASDVASGSEEDV